MGPGGETVNLDKETVQQVAILSEMKAKFGSNACLQAMMMLMAKDSDSKSGDEDTMSKAMEMFQAVLKKDKCSAKPPSKEVMNEAVSGPSGMTWPAVGDPKKAEEPAEAFTNKEQEKISFKWH